jgi:hypothetical protein
MSEVVQNVIADRGKVSPADERAALSSAVGLTRRVYRKGLSRPLAEQKMTGGPNSQFFNNLQDVTVGEQPRYYFDLSLWEVPVPSDGAPAEAVAVPAGEALRPGRKYDVRVSWARNAPAGLPPSTPGIVVVRELELTLDAAGGDAMEAVGPIENQGGRFPADPSPEWRHDFGFTVREGFPAGQVTLELRYREADTGHTPRPATPLEVPLAASPNILPREVAGVLSLPAGARLEQTAFLHVLPDGQDQVRFVGFPRDEVDSSVELAALSRRHLKPRPTLAEIENAVHDLAANNCANLNGWFGEVLELHGPACCVVVMDKADTRIPWELFKVARPKASSPRYLGCDALVVRWAEVSYLSQPVLLSLAEGQPTVGRLSAYVHPHEATATRKGCPILATLMKDGHFRSTDALEVDLHPAPNKAPVSLVYLASSQPVVYGHEEEKSDPVIGTWKASVSFRFNLLAGKLEPRPVFFVNAPYSGRLAWQRGRTFGLVKEVLAQVGAGYIGTMGPVSRADAVRVAQRLFQAASAAEGVQPAQLLRELRAEAVRELDEAIQAGKPQKVKEARERLRAAFLYVYYGNPRARLRVGGPAPLGGQSR